MAPLFIEIGRQYRCIASGTIVEVTSYNFDESLVYYRLLEFPEHDNKCMHSQDFKREFEKFLNTNKEYDPNGKSAHEPGAKMSAGKPRMGLVLGGFSKALEAVGEVGTIGAAKYSDNGWKEVPNGIAEYTDAMERHWLKESYEDFDSDLSERADKNIRHAACVAWNALARLNLMIEKDG